MIPSLIDYIKSSTLLRYIVVGGTSYAIELAVLLSMIHILHVSTALAVSVGFWIGFVISFLLQKFFTFKDTNTQTKRLTIQTICYALLVLFNYGFTLLFVHLFEQFIDISIARTIALIITTGWNYFIYKKVIFKDHQPKNPKKLAEIASKIHPDSLMLPVAVVGIILFSGLVFAGLFARPIADDFAYFNNIKTTGSVLEATSKHYQHHNGRLSQALVTYASFSVFGESATRIMPFLLLLTLALVIALLAIVLMPPGQKHKLSISVAIGLFLSGAIVITTPSLFDTLYWLTSGTVYVPSLIGLTLTLVQIVSIYKYPKFRKTSIILLLMPLVILSQSFGEGGATTSIILSVLCLFWILLEFSSRKKLLTPTLLLSIGLVAGFLVNFLSPATRGRQNEIDASHSISDLIANTTSPYLELLQNIEWWHVALAALMAIGISALVKIPRKIPTRILAMHYAAVILLLLILPLITFGVSAFAAGEWFATRNFLVPQALLFTAIVVAFLFFTQLFSRLLSSTNYLMLIYTATFLALIFSVPAMIQKQSIYIQALGLRDTFFTQRALSIEDQVAKESRYVDLTSLEVSLRHSEATDISYPLENEWILPSIKSYYSISDKETNIITSPQYCLNNYQYIREDNLCINTIRY